MRPVALVVLLLSSALAGCSSGDDPPAEPDADFTELDLSASSTTGVIRGVVVDGAIRPLEGAVVVLRGAPEPRTTTSTETGLFGFDGLDAGTYFLEVSRLGFLPTQTSADVVAGVAEPAIVRVQLAPDISFRPPYYEQFIFDGFIECSTGAGLPTGGYVYYSACSSDNPATGDAMFPNDRFAHRQILSGYPEWVQAEMTWDSTQSVSNWLSHSFHYSDPDELDGQKDLSVEGPSPLLNTMDNATAKEYIEGLEFEAGENLTLRQRVFTVATEGSGPALTLQQRFTVYVTAFYGYLPPEGWLLTSGEPVPPPPV